MSLVMVVVMVVLIALLVRGFKVAEKKQRSYLVLLALYILVPIVVIALVSLIRPLYLERYLSHVLIGGYMLIGAIIGLLELKTPSKKALLAGGGVLAVLLVGVVSLAELGNYNFQRLQKPMVKQAAAELSDCGPDQTILAATPYVAIELSYYLPQCEVRFYSETAGLIGGYAPLSESPLHVANPAGELAGSRELIYVYYGEPELVMPDTLTAAGRTSYGQLHVAEFYAEKTQ